MIGPPFIKGTDLIGNLDVTSRRSFVMIADAGGVTRAAAARNLTQSAVSMQIKRLKDIPWVLAVDSVHTRTVGSSVSADLAVHTVLTGAEPSQVKRIAHGGALPELGRVKVNLYVAGSAQGRTVGCLADLIRQAYSSPPAPPLASLGGWSMPALHPTPRSQSHASRLIP